MRFFLIIASTFAVDQASKYLVQANMLRGESIPIWSAVFHLTYIRNPGAAFGILANQQLFFMIVTFIVIAGILVGYKLLPSGSKAMHASLGLIMGGALGNLVDRLRLGSVVDFLDFRVWPVFNLADIAIVLGATMLVWHVWKSGEDGEMANEDAEG